MLATPLDATLNAQKTACPSDSVTILELLMLAMPSDATVTSQLLILILATTTARLLASSPQVAETKLTNASMTCAIAMMPMLTSQSTRLTRNPTTAKITHLTKMTTLLNMTFLKLNMLTIHSLIPPTTPTTPTHQSPSTLKLLSHSWVTLDTNHTSPTVTLKLFHKQTSHLLPFQSLSLFSWFSSSQSTSFSLRRKSKTTRRPPC